MTELQLQRLIRDAVNEAGGFAFQSSNRFLIGVADLMVKLPARAVRTPDSDKPYHAVGAGFLEVKQRDAWPSTETFELSVTVPQARFLQAAHLAGMPCGVVSFIQARGELRLNIQAWRGWEIQNPRIYANLSDHLPLAKKTEARKNEILTHLFNWHRAWRDGT